MSVAKNDDIPDDVLSDFSSLEDDATEILPPRESMTKAGAQMNLPDDITGPYPQVIWEPSILYAYGSCALVGSSLIGVLLFWVSQTQLLPAQILLVTLSIVVALGAVEMAKHYARQGLSLTSTSIRHSSWSRSVQFSDLERVEIRRSNNAIAAVLHFKEKRSLKEHGSSFAWKRSRIAFSLSGYTTQPDKIGELICRYYTSAIRLNKVDHAA